MYYTDIFNLCTIRTGYCNHQKKFHLFLFLKLCFSGEELKTENWEGEGALRLFGCSTETHICWQDTWYVSLCYQQYLWLFFWRLTNFCSWPLPSVSLALYCCFPSGLFPSRKQTREQTRKKKMQQFIHIVRIYGFGVRIHVSVPGTAIKNMWCGIQEEDTTFSTSFEKGFKFVFQSMSYKNSTCMSKKYQETTWT